MFFFGTMNTKIQWLLQIKKIMNLRTMSKSERQSVYAWLFIWLTLHDMARERILHGACNPRYRRPCEWPTPVYLWYHIIICHLLLQDLWNTLSPFFFSAWSIPWEEYHIVSFFRLQPCMESWSEFVKYLQNRAFNKSAIEHIEVEEKM